MPARTSSAAKCFLDVADMQARAVVWCRDLAGTRVHGTTRQVPRVVFETIEQPTLLPLAPAPFDRPTWAWATVHGDHHIKFRHALYSLPTRYLHQRVEVRADSRLVRIYHRGELIKVHPLQPIGGRATDYTDYPAALTPYAMRDPAACTRQAAQVGPAAEQFVRVLLSGVFPWARLRQAQKLLRLADRYGAARVNAACARALGFELLDVGRVETILRAALEREPGPTERGRGPRLARALRPRARELCPSPTPSGGVPCPWRSPLIWSVASSACAWAGCCRRCRIARRTRARLRVSVHRDHSDRSIAITRIGRS